MPTSKKLVKIDNIKGNELIFNFSLWISVLIMLTVIVSLNGSWPFAFNFLYMLSVLPAMMLFSYSMNYFSIHYMFHTRQIGKFSLLLILLSAFCAMLVPVLHHLIFFNLFYPRVFEPTPWFNWKTIPQNLILIWTPFFILSIRTFFTYWVKSEQQRLNIKNKQLLAEIQLMKIKLHPHFLFNTLNNLYAMSVIKHADTPGYILKLSEIYRVMLYECNKEYYPLHDELKLIENYIELEKIRYDKRLKLEVIFPDDVPEDILFPPLLLFTFVENAFKHGCRNDVENPFIKIKLSINEKYLNFESENSIPEKAPAKSKTGGIGLENTQKRLELIYRKRHKFTSGISNGQYNVALQIPVLTKNNITEY
ncbi:MAG: sensor histidine kinase [Prolixibacteraceae bacterium]|jgi:two-component system LytT family sensor kinase|nr:sensor histidine kinase [Prolixibacteraceae bacterium]